MIDELVAGWRTNQAINILLLDAISDDGLATTLSTRGGRDVARQFAHLHDVRVMQADKRAKELAASLTRFQAKGQATVTPTRAQLKRALKASADAVERLLVGVATDEPGFKGMRKGLFATYGYFVAHESHHRGSILLTLKQAGHNVEKSVRDGVWGWDQVKI